MGIPLVSVITITYNHEPYIAKTIEGVLMQQVNFPIEFIIAEDCSTDKTRNIVLDYANRYPEQIKVITSEGNVGAEANERRALLAARGKYIAFCEGDDYWTDPLKLQKQVDFLENNPEYSACFHRFRDYDVKNDILKECGWDDLFNENAKGFIIDSSETMLSQSLPLLPVAIVFRKDAFDLSLALQYKYYRDFHLFYHLLEKGKGFLFSFYGATRNLQQGGIFHSLSTYEKYQLNILIAEEVYKKNRTKGLEQYLICVIQNCIYSYAGNLNHKWMALYLSFKLFFIQKSFYRLGANIKRLFRKSILII